MKLSQTLPVATMTLILTSRAVKNFGRSFREGASSTAIGLYQQAIDKCFRPTVRPRFEPHFQVKWNKRVARYARIYDQVLQTFLSELGPSWFKLEYVKQLTSVGKELGEIGSTAHDVSELFRRHVVCCLKLGISHDLMFEQHPSKLEKAMDFLWESNYGITLLILLLQRELSSSLRVILDVNARTNDALSATERILPVADEKYRLSGSLEISEGNLDVPNEKAKR